MSEIIIPAFGKGDFATTAPFEWLYQFRKERFVMLQLQGRLKEMAGAVGVRNFMSLWRAYCESMRATEGVSVEGATSFTDQPIELMSGEYVCEDDGVTVTDKMGFDVRVISHPLLPVKRMENIDTGEQKMEIAFRRGNAWKYGVFDRTVLSSSQKIVDLSRYGMDITTENSRDVVKYLSVLDALNYDKIGEVQSVGRLGWVGNGMFSPYVDDLRYDGDANYQSMYRAVKQVGSLNTWIEAAKEGRRSSIVTRVMLAASFASVIVKMCDALPFFVHAWGGAGSGKTVGLMLATSVWANPESGAYWHTFNSTNVGREQMAGFLNSLPLCFDELQIVKDKRDFDTMIYTLCEGAGRLRGAKNGGMQQTVTWQNTIITTGEMPITQASSNGGAVNRVINADCQDEKLFENPREIVTTLRKNYGIAGRLFVEYVSTEEGRREVLDAQKAAYNALIDGEATDKQSLSASLLIAADAIASALFFNDGLELTPSDLEPVLVTKGEADFNARCYDWLCGFISANGARFDDGEDQRGECWGVIEGGYAYIVATVFARIMTENGYNAASFLSWARRNGKIKVQDDSDKKRVKYKKRIGKIPTWCVCVALPLDGTEVQEIDLPFMD